MTIRKACFWMAVGSAATLSVSSFFERTTSASASAATTSSMERAAAPDLVAASPGRVEGASEPVEVGAAADGLIQSVLVEEGQFVQRGTVMAQIACADIEAELRQAAADRDAAEQRRTRIYIGSRPDERAVAAQKVETAKAVLDEAARSYERIKTLAADGVIAQVTLDKARRDYEVARSQVEEMQQNQRLVEAPPVKEDASRAEAELASATEQVRVAQEKTAKCVVRAPISGTITRTFARPGQSFSTVMPKPLFTMSDVSCRRVRAQVDERDIGAVKIGQRVEATADAFPNRAFRGTVVQIYPSLGRKTVLTGDPAEKSDRDVLEVLIRLDSEGLRLPLGLRVAVQFLKG